MTFIGLSLVKIAKLSCERGNYCRKDDVFDDYMFLFKQGMNYTLIDLSAIFT